MSAPVTVHSGEITANSPCIGHCTTVLGDDVCRSCLRTFEEITSWPTITDEERIRINRRIAALSQQLNRNTGFPPEHSPVYPELAEGRE